MTNGMKNVARYDRGSVEKTVVTDEGYLRGEAIVTRAGVFLYQNPDGTVRRELRHPDEVFIQDSLHSMQLRPITNGHPAERLVTAENAKKLAIGFTGENIRTDGHYVIAPLVITDKKGVDIITYNNRRELSLGYTVDLLEEAGTYNGEPYTHRQTNIRYNHLAIVDRGRAGPEARIHLDAQDAEEIVREDIINNKEIEMNEEKLGIVTLDGIEYKTPPEVMNAYKKAQKECETLKLKLDEKIKETEKTLAEKDALKEKVEELESVNMDEAIQEAVKSRVQLINKAQQVLGNAASEVHMDSMSNIDIMKQVVMTKCPKANLDQASDIYIEARFDALMENLLDEKETAGIAKQRAHAAPKMDNSDISSVEQARHNMKNRVLTSWKDTPALKNAN